MTTAKPISILFLAASPVDVVALQLTREFEDIRSELDARCTGRFVVESRWHTKATDLPRLIIERQPRVLHFSGHGLPTGELLFEGDDARSRPADARAVAKVFELIGDSVRCVLLNACYSASQAELIAEHVDVVIGMGDRIRDADARRFAKSFYEMLSLDRNVGEAFELAKLGVWLAGSDGQDVPRLHVRSGMDATQVFVSRDQSQVADARAVPEYVFVAHARADKLRVAKLCRGLLERGVRPWFDLWDLRDGADWQAQIHEALRSAPAVLIVDGPSGAAADNVEYGAVLADRIERDGDTVFRVAWDEDLDQVAEKIGRDHDRRSWLTLEQQALGEDAMPYRGLRAFGERDARWMFGRDQEIGELLERFETGTRFLTVIGASGSGKSSLVLGGLCPVLRSGMSESGRVWWLATLRPGDRPCEALAKAVVDLQMEFGETADPIVGAGRVAALREQMLAEDDALRLVLGCMISGRSTAKILLVVDQLEELFTQARFGQRDASSQAMAFVRNLIEANKDEATPLWVVSTLRADFVPSCLAVAELARTLNSGIYFALPPMREEQIREAIVLPARRVGFEVEPRLLETLVAGAAEQAGRLPLLEHMLAELWRRRDVDARLLRHDAYVAVGGLEGAIASAAEGALTKLRGKLGDRASKVTRRLMTRLVRVGEGPQGDTRRRVTIDELGRDDQTRLVLDTFVREARVLVTDEVGGTEVIEIAHEALLREWSTLVGWVNADRVALRLQEEIARDAKKYGGKNQEYLWGRGRIEEAKRILTKSSTELNDMERGFINASNRAIWRQRLLLWGTVAAIFVMLSGALVFLRNLNAENEKQASDNAELAKSERLARRSSDEALAAQQGLRASMIAATAGSYIEASLVAIESLEPFAPDFAHLPAPVYDGMLRLANMEPVFEYAILDGHSGDGTMMAFSPDGTRVATAGSDDITVRLWDTASGKLLAVLDGHSDTISEMEFSPDGTCLATVSSDQTAKLWDATSGKLRITLEGHPGGVSNVEFLPDGTRVATAASDDSLVRLWDATSGEPLFTLEADSGYGYTAMAVSPDGTRIATAGDDNTVRLWDASGKLVSTLDGHSDFVIAVVFSPDGSRLGALSWGNTGRLWDPAFGELVSALGAPAETAVGMVFSPDGARLGTLAMNDSVLLWNAATGELVRTLDGHSNVISAMKFSPDSTRFVTASWDWTARLWDAVSGENLAILIGHSDWVTHATFSPDGNRLATVGGDNTARVWDAYSGRLSSTLDSHSEWVTNVAFSPDSRRLATAGKDNTVRLWNATSDKLCSTLDDPSTSNVIDVAFLPDGTRLATTNEDDIFSVWDVASGKFLSSFEASSGRVSDVGLSPDGTRFATADMRGTVELWDTASNELLSTLRFSFGVGVEIAFSFDGTRVATASKSVLRLWDVASGEPIFTGSELQPDLVIDVVFSPDGTRLATGNLDDTARLWDTSSGELLSTLDTYSRVTALVFSPDGTRLATASEDRAVRLWDVVSGELQFTLDAHAGLVSGVAFSPDGTRLATAGFDDTARLWNAATGELLATLDVHSARNVAFSPDGTRLAISSGDSVIIWPMPELAIRLACQQIQHAVRYSEVADICGPLLGTR